MSEDDARGHVIDSPFPVGLTAILMGRNEERYLPLSLPPLQQLADEIVFVDTGSEDRTVALAEAHGCRVLHCLWDDDFSAPKNLAITQAGYRWILNVDCDEVLVVEEGLRERILALCGTSAAPAWIVRIDNLMADGSSTPSQAMRLFRNDPRIRFVNPVHEGIADTVFRAWPDQPPEKIDLRLIHHGYSAGLNKEKIRRNVAILHKWVARDPHTIYGRYKLGMNLRFLGQERAGAEYLEQALRLADQDPDRSSLTFLVELVNTCYRIFQESGAVEQVEQLKRMVGTWNATARQQGSRPP
ncbi:MAG: glycosyltransferase family 2 protein [Magnetococcales bacterium]|nr:glycosyltransferase family 2 protein [Magnetococcales bacterium]